MKTIFKKLDNWQGIMRNLDPAEMPFGMAVTLQNMAQYNYGRLQRIPGISALSTQPVVDGQYLIPLTVLTKETGGSGTADNVIAIYVGNTNLLTVNQASVETDTTGFVANIGTEVLSRDGTTAQFGTSSLKTVTQATINSGFFTLESTAGIPVRAGQVYSFSCYLKTASAQAMNMNMNWYTAAGTYISTSTFTISVTTSFVQYVMNAITAPATAAFVAVGASINTATAQTIWADGLMFSLLNSLTSVPWVLPGDANTGAAPVLVNQTTGLSLSGPSMYGYNQQGGGVLGTGAIGSFSYSFYAQQHLFLVKGSSVLQVTNATTYVAPTFTGVPAGLKPELLRAYLDRLYVVDNTTYEGLVYYTDALTNNFGATNFVNVKEVPGPVTALGVYEPSTGATAGAVGIKGGLLIFKRNGIWYWDESSKDLISSKIGTLSPHSVVNSPVGTLFLGKRGDYNSVFVIPPGYYGYIHFGEPVDVGKNLYNLLNGSQSVIWHQTLGGPIQTWSGLTWTASVGLTSPHLAWGIVDGKFYKLYVSLGTDTQNQTELWLDLDALTQAPGEPRGGQPPGAVWYGPHTRGGFDSGDASQGTFTSLSVNANGITGGKTVWQENLALDANFLDWNGNIMVASLDVPLNFDPLDVEKIYDTSELHIAPEANLPGLTVAYNFLADNVQQGSGSATYEMDDSAAGPISLTHISIPLYGSGRTAAAAHHGRLQFSMSQNQRFDILGFTAQYITPEISKIFHHVRT